MDIFSGGEDYRGLWDYMLRNARRFVASRADAEDITQDAMLKLWRYLPERALSGRELKTYAYTTVKSSAVSFLRRDHSSVMIPLDVSQRVYRKSVETPETRARARELLEHALEGEDPAFAIDTLLADHPNLSKYKVRRCRMRKRMRQRLELLGYDMEQLCD